jgi:hypothetical protein
VATFILDTNICVDLYNGNLLEVTLRLSDTFLLPDVIIEELKEPEGNLFLSLGYQSKELSSEEVGLVLEYADIYTKPSRADLFALAAAKSSEITLLTGDENLKKAAIQEQVDVHGFFY